MIQQLLICSVFLLILSCGNEEAEFTMPEENLINLLYDIQVAEAAIQTVHSSVKDSVVAIYYDQIFELHGIDRGILLENIKVLESHPDEAHKIYKKVLAYHKEKLKQKK